MGRVARSCPFYGSSSLPVLERSDLRLVQRPCEARFLGLEIGASQTTLPIVAERLRSTPHIALSRAFLALCASVCNRWPRRWVSGTTARVAPGKNLPDSYVTSEPAGCYATPARLGGSSGICRTTRPVTCYEEAHSPCECSLLTLISRRPPRLVRGTHAQRPRQPGLRPDPGGDCPDVANCPAPHAHPATHHHWHVNVSIPVGWVGISVPVVGQTPRGNRQNRPNRQNLAFDIIARIGQHRAMLGETQKPILPHPRSAEHRRARKKQFPIIWSPYGTAGLQEARSTQAPRARYG